MLVFFSSLVGKGDIFYEIEIENEEVNDFDFKGINLATREIKAKDHRFSPPCVIQYGRRILDFFFLLISVEVEEDIILQIQSIHTSAHPNNTWEVTSPGEEVLTELSKPMPCHHCNGQKCNFAQAPSKS